MPKIPSQTLIKNAISAAKPRGIRRLSTQPQIGSSASEAEAMMVEKIEDVIHSNIVKRSKPDWLPFVPGASYWVPPRRSSYGVAEFVQKLSNIPTREEYLSLTTLQGWPSSAFYIPDVTPSQLDTAAYSETQSTETPGHDEEEAEKV